MSETISKPTGWRILGFAKNAQIAASVQESLCSLGYSATVIQLTNDEEGDARLLSALQRSEYDGVAIGGGINGQESGSPPEITAWFNRVLNIIHLNAPKTKIILARNPQDTGAIERILGKKAQ